eukprot:c24948_g3_i1 orf=1265-4363(-)
MSCWVSSGPAMSSFFAACIRHYSSPGPPSLGRPDTTTFAKGSFQDYPLMGEHWDGRHRYMASWNVDFKQSLNDGRNYTHFSQGCLEDMGAVGETRTDVHLKHGQQISEHLSVQGHENGSHVKDLELSDINGWRILSIEEMVSSLEALGDVDLPSMDVIIVVIQKCKQHKDVGYAMRLHWHACSIGLEVHVELGNYLVPMFVECGFVSYAEQISHRMMHINEISWTSLIQGSVDSGTPLKSFDLFHDMQDNGIYPSKHTYVTLVKASARLKNLQKGQELHGSIVKDGFDGNLYIDNVLVDMYARCGSFQEARDVFNEQPARDTVSWTALITGYSEHGLDIESIKCVKQMQREGVLPDSTAFVCGLKACCNMQDMDEGQALYAEIVKEGYERDALVGSTLVDLYAKFGLLQEAQEVFDKLPQQNVVLWNVLLSGYAEHGLFEEFFSCLNQMRLMGVSPDAVTMLASLKACGNSQATGLGQELHIEIIKRGIGRDLSVCNSLVNMYAKAGLLAEAWKVFDSMPVRDTVSWTALIAGYAEHGLGEEAVMCLKQMQVEGVSPNAVTYICCIKACRDVEMVDMGQTLHSEIVAKAFENDPSVGNALVDMYGKYGAVTEAQEVFSRLADRDAVSWNTLITSYADHEYGAEALTCFQRMQGEGICPTCVTYIGSLRACGTLRAVDKGQEIHRKIVTEGLEKETLVFNGVVSMYIKCGYFLEAWKLFSELPSRDVIAWNVLISGYAASGQEEEAMECFVQMCMEGISPDTASWNSVMLGFAKGGEFAKAFELYAQMQDQGCLPDRVIVLSVLVACGNALAVESGRRIHSQICRVAGAGVALENALIDMYGKCGRMADAQNVFNAMAAKNGVTWSTLIAGYACEGRSKLVLDLFEIARQEAAQLDGIAVLGVLTACSHTGLVDKGQKFFKTMRESYAITPTMEHFACMVDLHGRAGQLNEALALIKRMPFQPSLVVWLTLLGACKKWGNVGLGRMAFDHAIRVKERDASVFKLMSQIYIGAQMWEEAKQIEAIWMTVNDLKE